MTPGGGGGEGRDAGFQVSIDDNDRRMFLGLKCSIPECFG